MIERVRKCQATLVPPSGEISDDARRLFDVALPPAGCERLVCTTCDAPVSYEAATKLGDDARVYASGCSRLAVTVVQWPERDDDRMNVYVPPWACSGHPEATLPFSVDGFVCDADVDVARLFLHAVSATVVAKDPDDWLSRVRRIAEGTPLEAVLDLAPLSLITHADVRVRALAIVRARSECRARAGVELGRRIVAALREHAELFEGVPAVFPRREEPRATGQTLEDQLIAELASTSSAWPIADAAAREHFRTWLLTPHKAARASWRTMHGVLSDDSDWLLEHARAILDASPTLAIALMEAIEYSSLGERAYASLDIEVLRRCALALAGTRKRRVFEWLREHDAVWAEKNIAGADRPKNSAPFQPAPPRWDEAQTARFAEQRAALAQAIRAGGTYMYRDQDSAWKDCVFDKGKFVMTSGYYMDNTTGPTIELDDEHALADNLTASFRDHPKLAIDTLERALHSVRPRTPEAPSAPPEGVPQSPVRAAPEARETPGAMRFKTPGMWGIHLLRYPGGAVKQGFLDGSHVRGGHEWICEIAFYESGQVKAGRLHVATTLDGVPCYDIVSLFESGKVRAAKLSEAFVLQGRRFKAGQYVDVDESGRARAGCLDETRGFVRIDEAGKATPAVMPALPTPTWEAVRGARRIYASLTAEGMVYGSASGAFDDNAGECTLRELLHGAFDEGLRSDFGDMTLREMRRVARALYLAVSDGTLDFEPTD